jgi:MFS family permease
MAASPQPSEARGFLKGSAALLITVGAVTGLLIEFPAYRWFFLISVGIGVVVAVALYLWNKHVPVKAEDVESNKRPLGLD